MSDMSPADAALLDEYLGALEPIARELKAAITMCNTSKAMGSPTLALDLEVFKGQLMPRFAEVLGTISASLPPGAFPDFRRKARELATFFDDAKDANVPPVMEAQRLAVLLSLVLIFVDGMIEIVRGYAANAKRAA